MADRFEERAIELGGRLVQNAGRLHSAAEYGDAWNKMVADALRSAAIEPLRRVLAHVDEQRETCRKQVLGCILQDCADRWHAREVELANLKMWLLSELLDLEARS